MCIRSRTERKLLFWQERGVVVELMPLRGGIKKRARAFPSSFVE